MAKVVVLHTVQVAERTPDELCGELETKLKSGGIGDLVKVSIENDRALVLRQTEGTIAVGNMQTGTVHHYTSGEAVHFAQIRSPELMIALLYRMAYAATHTIYRFRNGEVIQVIGRLPNDDYRYKYLSGTKDWCYGQGVMVGARRVALHDLSLSHLAKLDY